VSGGFRRGFKKECEEIVAEVRDESGLARYAPFDPFAYAAALLIPCEPMSCLVENGCAPEALAHVAGVGRDDFSAITVYRGTRRRIFYNDRNSPTRQRSDVSHELSHVLLEHEPTPIFDSNGTRRWNAAQEREAAWLSGALLVPAHIALGIARRGIPIDEAAECYGVSVQLMRWRLRATGALIRARRERSAKQK
jgi:hypothetical protein